LLGAYESDAAGHLCHCSTIKMGVSELARALDRGAAQHIIEAMAVLAAAVVALQISQTIIEEEVVRDGHVSGPTRVRRFLSRFLVVVVVALGIEALVSTFRASHGDSAKLLYAAALVLSIGGPSRRLGHIYSSELLRRGART